ncbi:capsid assembly protein [Roseospira visakhapatnamensis]|uniref:Uncharacterized protein n=1 Tax=Roseospira visakhapatnamensis TaxID=390880 RepID=A0A7W6RCP9_9PROT|nr:hypothetical protein [Roseospira visakhapatnamensis]MBB4266109.1 hypothetical protein [Roseospira visakhapatnamensis]
MVHAPPSGPAGPAEPVVPSVRPASSRPRESLAARFRDPVSGRLDAGALLSAYEDLLRRAQAMVMVPGPDADDTVRARFRRALGIPDDPGGYRVTVRHPRLAVDPKINARLHAAGFTPEQVQVVYDLAAERVMPVIEAMSAGHRADTDLAALVQHFGGDDRWSRISRQLSAWGKAHLSRDVYRALASTREGVLALSRMMTEGEPGLVAGDGGLGGAGGAGEEDLKALMRDPRYWKHRDPAVLRRVAEGFRRLYPQG